MARGVTGQTPSPLRVVATRPGLGAIGRLPKSPSRFEIVANFFSEDLCRSDETNLDDRWARRIATTKLTMRNGGGFVWSA